MNRVQLKEGSVSVAL
ncbi:tetracycline resistance efflux system leader peptide [Bacillus stercoris]|nr:tetracycline resistance efflux system leader peptide [Bacillus stercoris]